MGSMQSRMSRFQYHRLPNPGPSSTSLTKPLLNFEAELMEQEVEMEANEEKNEALDRAFGDMQSAVSRLQFKVSKIESRPPIPLTAKQDAEIHELKLRVAKLELLTTPTPSATLEKELKELKHGVEELDHILPTMKKKQEEAIEKLGKKLVELMTDAIHEIKSTTGVATNQLNLKREEEEEELRVRDDHYYYDHNRGMDDLLGCLVILIFLVSLLIGLKV